MAPRLSSFASNISSSVRVYVLDRLPNFLAPKSQSYITVAGEESFGTSTEEKSESYDVSGGRQRPAAMKIAILIIVATIFLAELLLLIFLPMSEQDATSNEKLLSPPAYKSTEVVGFKDCGDSADISRDRGCQFDYLTISWQRPECYHSDIIDDFFETHDWEFYIDANGTKIPSWDEMPSGSRRYNVRWDFHFTHCIYAWRMMQTAIYERRPLANYLLGIEHTRHCMEVGLDRRWEWTDMHTLVHVKWPQCLPYGQWNTTEYVDNLVLD